ncbi:hypothetical protein SeMB42_g02656 [Synchytrium endobioticum]|uniref:PCI domain-containing protein n=1 Tax=Synchytrium endobioticum TaxID=286115 RepID=A0A507D9P9_9FUNG|nr:hypothetical protein SeLEV6574_g02130 [Synchytrium endobioticum]TPX49276.1 hypothetical protein SeMB42_g02656 [Synchytrium endobioticum]
MAAQLSQAASLRDQLKKELSSPSGNLDRCGELLVQLKIILTQLSFLVLDARKSPDVKELVLARDVLELGAQYATKRGEIEEFERYISQLKTYYHDYKSLLPPSEKQYSLLGLNLLNLLAQNRISEFHTELESLPPEELTSNMYLRHPVEVEQYLMEGSYGKVVHSRENVPATEYAFFMDILMGTIRDEIASCSAKAYTGLPIPDAVTLLYFKNREEVLEFAKRKEWNVNLQENKIYFATTGSGQSEIPSEKMIRQTLSYARELERIV